MNKTPLLLSLLGACTDTVPPTPNEFELLAASYSLQWRQGVATDVFGEERDITCTEQLCAPITGAVTLGARVIDRFDRLQFTFESGPVRTVLDTNPVALLGGQWRALVDQRVDSVGLRRPFYVYQNAEGWTGTIDWEVALDPADEQDDLVVSFDFVATAVGNVQEREREPDEEITDDRNPHGGDVRPAQ